MTYFVAKSYENLTRLSEPYEQNGKIYINIELKSGKEKAVRGYTAQEYKRMYPDVVLAKISHVKPFDPYYKSQKETLGFTKGFIWIFDGITEDNEDYFAIGPFRHTRWWGWYLPSWMEMPLDLPNNVRAVKLPWEPMGDEEDWLVENEKIIKECVDKVLFADDITEYAGEIGQRLVYNLEVIETHDSETAYGVVRNHIFQDPNGNLLSWKTKAKKYEVGDTMQLKGTVHLLSKYKNKKITVLQRCVEL